MKYHFRGILQREGWLENAEIETDSSGIITSISVNNQPHSQNGFAIPGFENAHSHAFQYAMAGLAEFHVPGANADDFWSWRNEMYKLALVLNPDQIEAIAAYAYAEMVRHGYTHVAEFHYLHRDTSGLPYMNIAEIGERLISAAAKAGIGITLIPVFYQRGGFGKPLEKAQRRFFTPDIDSYLRLLDASIEACAEYGGANAAIGIHSLRAVESETIKQVASDVHTELPFHIHIAEQKREVKECIAFLKNRPVKWMLENVNLGERYNLVHATHIDSSEIYGLTDTKTNVVLCPSTEANLGDGIFPLHEFQTLNGSWSIGSDSNICLNPFEELRLLDYGQRLTYFRRDTFASHGNGDSAQYAVNRSWEGGKKAMSTIKIADEFFSVGSPLDALVLSKSHPLIESTSPTNLLNTILYSSDPTFYEGTIIRGIWRSRGTQHIDFDSISESFLIAMQNLKNR